MSKTYEQLVAELDALYAEDYDRAMSAGNDRNPDPDLDRRIREKEDELDDFNSDYADVQAGRYRKIIRG